MAYISGTIGNFMPRLHQLPTGIADLSGVSNNFWLEGQSYKDVAPVSLLHTWSREFKKKYYIITHSGLTGFMFQPSYTNFNTPVLIDNVVSNTMNWSGWSYSNPDSWNIYISPNGVSYGINQVVTGTSRLTTGTIMNYYKIQGISSSVPSTNFSNVIVLGSL